MQDFNNYINQLNRLDSQENRSELENFYHFNAGLLQFFKGIDSQITAILNAPIVNPKSVELIQAQINDVLPTLNKIKFEISMFHTDMLSEAHKVKINRTIAYTQNNMTVGEVESISYQLFDLLQKNETAFAQEKAEQERKKQAERERIAREEAERKAKEERERKERIAREEAERKAREEREKKEDEERKEKLGIAYYLGLNIDSHIVKPFLKEFGIRRNYNNSFHEKYSNDNGAIQIRVDDSEKIIAIGCYWLKVRLEDKEKYQNIYYPNKIRIYDSVEKIEAKIGEYDSDLLQDGCLSYFWEAVPICGKFYDFHTMASGESRRASMSMISIKAAVKVRVPTH